MHQDPPLCVPLPGAMHLHIHPGRQEVMWRDGSAVGLLPVFDGRHARLCLRAVRDGTLWHVVDLALLADEIEADLVNHVPRDRPGIVWFTLRGGWPNAEAFLAAVRRAALLTIPCGTTELAEAA